MKIRVGFGFDVHQLVTGRELWLGGIKFEHELGLLGHSDADVLIHAICDALLGAANMRDIGYHFPDTAGEFKNIDSKILLAETVDLIAAKGYKVGNVDATICAERPKLKARKDIIEKLAKAGIKPTAMMDISDGLSSELLHICSQSDTGCRVYEERIPIDYQTAVMAEELNMNVTTCALNGGEDYELLFTVPLTEHERVSAIEGIKVIGHITKPELGCALITRDGQEFELKAQGWNPLKEK